MKFLIDNNLSPLLAEYLKAVGHDAVHIRDYGLQGATDPHCAREARDEARVLISADTDFGTILAREKANRPSLLLIRRLVGRRTTEQAAVILANLESVAASGGTRRCWPGSAHGDRARCIGALGRAARPNAHRRGPRARSAPSDRRGGIGAGPGRGHRS
jgi:predicted nuclease of predicted toxin-antitoxin system